ELEVVDARTLVGLSATPETSGYGCSDADADVAEYSEAVPVLVDPEPYPAADIAGGRNVDHDLLILNDRPNGTANRGGAREHGSGDCHGALDEHGNRTDPDILIEGEQNHIDVRSRELQAAQPHGIGHTGGVGQDVGVGVQRVTVVHRVAAHEPAQGRAVLPEALVVKASRRIKSVSCVQVDPGHGTG